MRKLFLLAPIAALVLLAGSAFAGTVSYGWEDGGAVLGTYSDIIATNVTAPDPVHTGTHSLKLVDNNATATEQAYVGWIRNLAVGDVVTASVWVYDTTPSGSPSGRIWGHWSDNNDINAYGGSAGGNSAYPDGTGWSQLSYSWTVADVNLGQALVIEVRTYSAVGDTVWADDLSITAPDTASVVVPAAVPEPSSLAALLTGITGLVGFTIRRKR